MWEKDLIALPFPWLDGVDIETLVVFGNTQLGAVRFDQLRHWQNTDVNRSLLIDFF